MSILRDPNGPDGCAQRPPWACADGRQTVEINGATYPLLLGRTAAWLAIEAAGIRVWRTKDGKTIRAYDPKPGTGGYLFLTLVHANGAAYPYVEKGGGKVSGAFAARVRSIVESAVNAAREDGAS